MLNKLVMDKPSMEIEDTNRINLNEETMGQSLPSSRFRDFYDTAEEKGLSYFYRIDGKGEVSFVIIFDDIDDFSQSTEARIYLEFEAYKNLFMTVVWTLPNPEDPLGFPVKFDLKQDRDYYASVQFLQQKETWIHYLAWEDNQLIHIFSEAITFTDKEKEKAAEMVWEARHYQLPAEMEEEQPYSLLSIHEIAEIEIQREGTQYLFDYRAMIKRFREEQKAREYIMATLNQILSVFKRLPRAEISGKSFTTWAGEKTGINQAGRETSILSLIVCPSLDELFANVDLDEKEDNPFNHIFLSFPEFIGKQRTFPLQGGAYPIVHYEKGKISYFEPDETMQSYLSSLYQKTYPQSKDNPYKME